MTTEPLYKAHIPLFPPDAKFLGSIQACDYWLLDGEYLAEVGSDIEDDSQSSELFDERRGITRADRIAMHFGVEFSPAAEARMVKMIFRDWMSKTRGDAFIREGLSNFDYKLGEGNLWTKIRDEQRSVRWPR
jgi:hypothetical protein